MKQWNKDHPKAALMARKRTDILNAARAQFLDAGYMKLTKSAQGLADIGWHWATSLPLGFIRFLAVMEILGAIGIILPSLTGIMPYLSNLAAIGMILIQIAAIILHAKRQETKGTIVLNLILLAAAVFIAWKL